MIRKERIAKIGVGRLCKLFGKTRQAYYDRLNSEKAYNQDAGIVLELVAQVRRELPGIGTHKLYRLIREPLKTHGVKMGRDKLHQLLKDNGLLISRKARIAKTTNSKHWLRCYPNLIKDLNPVRPEAIWVSDITYICVGLNFNYLSLVTDAYSRFIMGYYLHTRLDTDGPLKALDLALKNRIYKGSPLIHHSDRGVQYCSYAYIQKLRDHGIGVSMTEQKDAYENAIAERVNGILKTEFGLYRLFNSHKEAKELIHRSIDAYNWVRPHMSCDMLTPAEAH